MKIKTKLSLGLISLFIILLVIGSLGFFAINILANNAQLVLKDNYESVQYAKNMHQALDALENGEPEAMVKFESNLVLQEHNITEIGEGEATHDLRSKFNQLKKVQPTPVLVHSIRRSLYLIEDLNTNAIVRKHNETQHTADRAKAYLGIITTLLLLLTFTFIVNFPGFIANPIQELTEGIKRIADEDYSSRLHFKSSDEFGELATAFNAMAKQLQDYRNSSLAEIILEKKYTQTIINNMKDPVIGLSENNVIQFANKEAVKVLGLNENDLIGKYAPDIALKNDLVRTLLVKEESTKPLKIYADNKESYFTKENYQIVIENQKLGNVVLLRNITYFQELNLAKTNFIATISHELKTPISSIKMSLALLEDNRVGTTNPEQTKLIIAIKEDAQRLLKITGELLDMAQVETGHIQLQKMTVKPKEIVDYAFNATKQIADMKQVSVIINCPESLPDIMCDPEKTAWVMINLLTNAIRYCAEKTNVYLNVTYDNEHTIFAVKDSGGGIEHIYLDRVFEKYFRVPGSNETLTGSGLGLALAKELIEAQNGKIWVESEKGKGSTFYFSL